VLAAALAALIASVPAVGASAAPSSKPCHRLPINHSRCLRIAVPLDRSGVLPGTISLFVRIEPPRSGTADGTILALAGGPGQAAAPLLERFMAALPRSVLRSHRLVTFDQRGTGGSGRLTCSSGRRSISGSAPLEALDPEQPVLRAVAACAARLGPARAHYATADSVADVEAVRAALGIDRLTLWGTSYGTKVALDYAAAYPQHVDRLLLDSVAPPAGIDPFDRITIGSMRRVMRTICAGRCRGFTRDPATDLDVLAQRLARGPLRGRWVDGGGGSEPMQIAQPRLIGLLLAGDFSPAWRALLPAAIHAARSGDPALLLRLAMVAGSPSGSTGGISDALFLATHCEDGSVPWAPGTPIAGRAAAIAAALAAIPPAQLAPFGAEGVRALGGADLCRTWPESPIVQPRLPLPDVPTLILSGALDLRTPRANALALAAQMPGARVVNVPQTGHSTLDSDRRDCARSAVAAFFAGVQPSTCALRRQGFFERPADVPPRSLEALRPLAGVPPAAGRTLAAVRETVVLLVRTVFIELFADARFLPGKSATVFIGGLRGGSLVLMDDGRAFMRDYSVVPGVTLSGEVDGGQGSRSTPVVVRIGGSAGAHGWLRLGDRWTTGWLDGRRIRVRSQRLVPITAATARAAAGPGVPDGRPLPSLPAPLRALLRIPVPA